MAKQSAYEIRLSVLQEAVGIEMENRHRTIEKLQIDADKNNGSYELPADLSADSVLETANKLYEFVEGS